jgi:hypothetical protein
LNWPADHVLNLVFLMQGEQVEVVTEFIYLGNLVPTTMRMTAPFGIIVPGREEHVNTRVRKLLPIFYTACATPSAGLRFTPQVITFTMSAFEYGAGVFFEGKTQAKACTATLRKLACKTFGLPQSIGGTDVRAVW